MNELDYLNNTLGLRTKEVEWQNAGSLPAFLKAGNQIVQENTRYGSFILARPRAEASLPEIKRTHSQLARRAGLPVAVSVPQASARQRAALVGQGIPFICAGREVFLPFIGMASQARSANGARANATHKLSAKGLQAACWAMLHAEPFTLAQLKCAAGMSSSQASTAAAELVTAGLVCRATKGRTVIIKPLGQNEILRNHMSVLSSPVRKVVTTRRTTMVDSLPNAGETALATRTMLEEPAIVQKAIAPKTAHELEPLEIEEGELPNEETAHVQIWRYPPVFHDASEVDNISLALSLANAQDERIGMEVDSLFAGEEYPWQEAQ